MKDPAVLFVCTGNICRSPMAAALFRARLKQTRSDDDRWRVDSAGTWTDNDRPASANAQIVMGRRGLDISAHRSRQVTGTLLAEYDLILTMEPHHKEALLAEFPKLANRIFLLSEMEGHLIPVPDPYGSDVEIYEQTARQIDRILGRGMKRILDMLDDKQAAG